MRPTALAHCERIEVEKLRGWEGVRKIEDDEKL